ncbi:hypothetical protein ACFY71_35995 [Streptomyces cinerochromogenes]|uniref:hypothetical protein n=1 Tax=Streptomyces cinerochromogenes TaxID=66422 RepID=UPI0036A1803E
MTRTGYHCDVSGRPETSLPASFQLEYLAFRQLHHATYLEYAFIRTGNRMRAVRCVETVFGRLCATWHDALRGCPAGRAWAMLREHASHLTDCSKGHSWAMHCLLDERQADVMLLHRRLSLTIEEAADVMGMENYTVRSLLWTAEAALRALPSCVAPLFVDTLYEPGARGAEAAHGRR